MAQTKQEKQRKALQSEKRLLSNLHGCTSKDAENKIKIHQDTIMNLQRKLGDE